MIKKKAASRTRLRCDLLKIHYLCGDKDNFKVFFIAIMFQLFEVTSPMNLH